MFAFALWDPERRVLALARDRVGIKPLYWTRLVRGGAATVLFAPELRALLASGLVERRLDPLGLATYLWNGFTVGPGTIVPGISLLAAGSWMELDEGGAEIATSRFWECRSGDTSASSGADTRCTRSWSPQSPRTPTPGASTGWHRHDAPLYGHMLEGELTVTYRGHGVRVYRAGDTFMEAFRTPHNGHNSGDGPVRILAVFVGAEGVANTVKLE